MKEEFVTLEIAKKLKEKGYNGKTTGKHVEKIPGTEREEWDDAEMMYVTVTDIVTYPNAHIYDVLKWLREKNIHVYSDFHKSDGWLFEVTCLRTGVQINTEYFGTKSSYEKSILAGIEYTLDNLI